MKAGRQEAPWEQAKGSHLQMHGSMHRCKGRVSRAPSRLQPQVQGSSCQQAHNVHQHHGTASDALWDGRSVTSSSLLLRVSTTAGGITTTTKMPSVSRNSKMMKHHWGLLLLSSADLFFSSPSGGTAIVKDRARFGRCSNENKAFLIEEFDSLFWARPLSVTVLSVGEGSHQASAADRSRYLVHNYL